MRPDEIELKRDAWGRLIFVEAGIDTAVHPVRAFPVSDPDHWLSLVAEGGREAVCIERIADMNSAARQLVEEELARREFMPIVEKILSTNADRAPAEWRILTNRGVTNIRISAEEHVHRLAPHRFLIVDAHGIRFLIPNALSLDAQSRRILDKYL